MSHCGYYQSSTALYWPVTAAMHAHAVAVAQEHGAYTTATTYRVMQHRQQGHNAVVEYLMQRKLSGS